MALTKEDLALLKEENIGKLDVNEFLKKIDDEDLKKMYGTMIKIAQQLILGVEDGDEKVQYDDMEQDFDDILVSIEEDLNAAIEIDSKAMSDEDKVFIKGSVNIDGIEMLQKIIENKMTELSLTSSQPSELKSFGESLKSFFDKLSQLFKSPFKKANSWINKQSKKQSKEQESEKRPGM